MRANAVNTYRVYFFGAGDRIIQRHDFEAVDDAEAITRAEALCRERPECIAIEIWQAFRLLHVQARAA
jgi:hypothetical protein